MTPHPDTGKPVHVLAYQNTPENLSDDGNAMVLHIPSAQAMGPENFIDAASAPRFLRDIANSVLPEPVTRGGGQERGATYGAKAAPAQVFSYGDIYTVVVADSVDQIEEALSRVPERRRPTIAQEILDFYGKNFGEWKLVLCCFDSRDAREAPPVVVWYETLFPDLLIAPGIDGHDGRAPSFSEPVEVDHQVFFGHQLLGRHVTKVRYGNWEKISTKLREFLPQSLVGKKFRGELENGDFVLELKSRERSGPRVDQTRRFRPTDYPQPAMAA